MAYAIFCLFVYRQYLGFLFGNGNSPLPHWHWHVKLIHGQVNYITGLNRCQPVVLLWSTGKHFFREGRTHFLTHLIHAWLTVYLQKVSFKPCAFLVSLILLVPNLYLHGEYCFEPLPQINIFIQSVFLLLLGIMSFSKQSEQNLQLRHYTKCNLIKVLCLFLVFLCVTYFFSIFWKSSWNFLLCKPTRNGEGFFSIFWTFFACYSKHQTVYLRTSFSLYSAPPHYLAPSSF